GPFLRLKDHGRRCIEKESVLPHDPDGYLKDFQADVPGADPVVVEYLTEALQCFLRDLQRASAVMLGAASEKAVLQLIESYANAISDGATKCQVEGQILKAASIFRKFDVFEKGFVGVKTN